MSGNNILSLLGLALRAGRLAIGEEPVALAAKAGQARLLLAASDAAGNTLRRMEHLAEEGHCLRLVLPFSKAELGGALGRGSAAVAALTDTGLAAAVTARLAELDPERYGEAAARMELKRRRAEERKAAPRRSPPEKAPPPKAGDRRPSKRREDPKDGRRPDERRAGKPRSHGERGARGPAGTGRSQDGRAAHGPSGTNRPQGGRPKQDRFQSGKPGHPGGRGFSRPAGGKSGRPPRPGSKPHSGGGRSKGGGR